MKHIQNSLRVTSKALTVFRSLFLVFPWNKKNSEPNNPPQNWKYWVYGKTSVTKQILVLPCPMAALQHISHYTTRGTVTNTINVLLGFIVVLTTAKGTRQGRLTVANQSPAFSETLGRRGLTGIAAGRWTTINSASFSLIIQPCSKLTLSHWSRLLLAAVAPQNWQMTVLVRTLPAQREKVIARWTLTAREVFVVATTTVGTMIPLG